MFLYTNQHPNINAILAVSDTPPEPAPHWNCQKMPRSFDGAPSWAHRLMSIWRKPSICHNLWHISRSIGNDGSMMGCWFLLHSGQENWLELNSGKFRKPSFTVQVVGGSYLPDLFPAQYDTGISPCLNSYLSSKRNLVVTTMTGLSCLMDGVPEPEIWPGTNTTKYIMSVIKIKIKKQLFGIIRVQPWWYALGCGFAKLPASRTIASLLKH